MANNNLPEYDPQKETPTVFAARLLRDGFPIDDVLTLMEKKIGFLSFPKVINEYLGIKKITVTSLMATIGVNSATFYKYTTSDAKKHRNPSRNVILRMALAMQLSLDQTQILLKSAKRAAISGSNPRDIIIMNAIMKTHKAENDDDEIDYFDIINDELTAKNLPDLFGDNPEDKN